MDTPEWKLVQDDPDEFQEPEPFLDPLFADEEACEWPLKCCARPVDDMDCNKCPYQREFY